MLSKFQKLYFGMARLGPSIMLDMLDLASTLFYFSIQALPAIFTGISVAMSYVSIMVAELVFGNLSDRRPTKRWGRRKPFVIIGAPLMAIAFFFVFNPGLFVIPGDTLGLFFYSLITLSLFKVFYGMTMTPFQSWMPELTEPEERPAVSSWQNVANFLGFVIGTFGTSLIAVTVVGLTLPPIILYMIIIFIIIQLVGFIPPLVGLKKEGKFIPQPNLREDLRRAARNRDFLGWLAAQGLLSVGIAMIIKSTFPYINDYLKFGTIEFLIFGVELLMVVFVFFLIYQVLIRRRGKRFTLQFALMLGVISLPFTLFVTEFTGGVLLIALVGASVAGYYLFPYIIYADFANVDEIITGEGRAGFYTSFPSIPLNLMQAFAGFMWGVIFSLPEIVPIPGYPEADPISQGYLYWGPFAAIFLLLSVLVLFKTDIDPDFKALKTHTEGDEPPSID